ncbi:hypothetical protein AB4P91_27725 (plasmid) [Pseudomonas sp. B21128]
MSDKTEQLPQLPQGLRTELHVVSNKGMTGNKSWVLRDLKTDELYELTPSTISGWDIPEGQLDGPGIIVTMVPDCVTLQLSNGQLYRDLPPADSTTLGHPVHDHLDTRSTLTWTPDPRPFGQAVGAQRRRFALLV